MLGQSRGWSEAARPLGSAGGPCKPVFLAWSLRPGRTGTLPVSHVESLARTTRRPPSGSIAVARPAVRGHHRVPPGLCAGARTADPRRRSGPGRAPCRSRCPTRRRRQASAPSCRAAARPTAPPARHHVLLPEVHVGAVWAVPRACRAGLCRPCGSPGRTNPRPPPGCASVPHSSSRHPRPPRPAGRQRRACIQSPTLVQKINQRVEGHLAARGGGPGIRRARGGTFFAVPSFASRRF